MSWSYEPGEQPPRPEEVRRLSFEDLMLGGLTVAEHVVPLEQLRPGDRQAGLFRLRGDGVGGPPAPKSIDGLAGHPEVDSVVGAGYAVARRPLPQIRELAATWTDEETLANLPNLRTLVVRSAPGDRPLDPRAVPEGLAELSCRASKTFASVEALERFGQLEKLALDAFDASVKPLAQLARLRWLMISPGKDVRALGVLEELEWVHVRMDASTLSSLKPFAKWKRVRSLHLAGRPVKSLEGVEALESLERLSLFRTGVSDLEPLAGHPALKELHLDTPDRVREWPPLRLPALRRLTVDLNDDAPPTLAFLRGCDALEEVDLIGGGALDRDPSPLAELPALERAGFYGDYPPEAVEAVRAARPEARIDWRPPFDWDEPREPLTPFVLPGGQWTIFEDVTGLLDVESNHDAERLIRTAVSKAEPELAERLGYDSEGSAFAVTGTEADLRRVAEIIRALEAPRSS